MGIVKKIVDRANAPDNARPKIVLSLQLRLKMCKQIFQGYGYRCYG